MRQMTASNMRTKGELKYRAIKTVLRLRRFSRAYGTDLRARIADDSRSQARCPRCNAASADSAESASTGPSSQLCLHGKDEGEIEHSRFARSRFRPSYSTIVLIALTTATLAISFSSNPFPDTLAEKSVSLKPLTQAQKVNLALAARRLDGYVMQPGESFSFNGVVGPRSGRKGYQPARSYLGSDSPETLGGGICLLSSSVYQLALETRQDIVERVAHLRTVKTVPPGLDATVWYGQADLRFKNASTHPIQLKAAVTPGELRVKMLGRNSAQSGASRANSTLSSFKRFERRRSADQLLVEVFRTDGAHDVLISRDLYRTR